jgi:hypothetical protein
LRDVIKSFLLVIVLLALGVGLIIVFHLLIWIS